MGQQSGLSYAVIGTGAIGGFYGALLQRAGCEVHFLLRSDYEYVQQHGLVVNSVYGDFTLPEVNAYCDASAIPRCDVAIAAIKATQNHILEDILPRIVKPNGTILLLQNGIGVEPQLAKLLPDHYILSGLCFICSNKVGMGHVHHLDYGDITIGAYADRYAPAGITKEMEAIASDFNIAGVPAKLTENLQLARWRKLVWNIPFNGLSVVLDAKTDAMMANDATRQLSADLMNEVLAAAAACDCQIPTEFVPQMIDFTTKMQPYLTSMKLDYDHKRSLEIEAIYANPLRLAKERGVAMPKTEMLYQQLYFLDRLNSKSK
ncbi:ketopantoate reductase [Thalassoporum mexicanum PCC 7367]|uniref:putative 2-dehydropantoate 2-reductase n=1 Tax=Thalassoporum mexicanum TaxID=3457544 RepID=UPI00029FC3AD|nr:putative 2-dehydropantoate 2-reductase [Pseudanabaena sp. PCC 7367]AFY68455.1 ketopantoate reductase [Pseudanabaena sp. PCC 7367]